MRKIFIYIYILFSGFVGAQNTIKVMTFNIHAASDATIDMLAEFIKKEKPDIVALQEVDFYTDRSASSTPRPNNNNEDMLTSLAYKTNMQGIFIPAINAHGGKYGIAILSIFGFESSESISLSYVSGTERRVAGLCSIELPNKRLINFLCAHLDMANHDNGLNQIKELNNIAKSSQLPIILGGDLNKRVGTSHIDELLDVWKLSLSNEFDHIGYLSDDLKIVSTKIYTDNILSDHLPLMVTFEIQ